MGIGNITSKLTTGAKEVAKTFKETSAPKMKKAVEQKAKTAAEIAQDAYGRAAVKLEKSAFNALDNLSAKTIAHTRTMCQKHKAYAEIFEKTYKGTPIFDEVFQK